MHPRACGFTFNPYMSALFGYFLLCKQDSC